MPWIDRLKHDPIPWLLEPESPGVRYLALRDITALSENEAELRSSRAAAHREGPIAEILAHMIDPGYWEKPGPGYNPKYRSTVWSLIFLAQLGASIHEDERIARACVYLLDQALTTGGQFSSTGTPSGTIDCLQGNLCWALTELGCEDPRLESAFEWMARSITGEGVAPVDDKQAAVRYYAYKCGPGFACGANYTKPCAWGAVKTMLAFANLPEERRTPLMNRAVQTGVDFLLGVDPLTADYPRETENPNRSWWKLGFPVFYITDVLQILEALARLGYGGDPRLANAVEWLRDKQNEQGQWAMEYDYTGKTWVTLGEKRQPNKWVTLRALRVLKAVG
jgi:hypothetical protein